MNEAKGGAGAYLLVMLIAGNKHYEEVGSCATFSFVHDLSIGSRSVRF